MSDDRNDLPPAAQRAHWPRRKSAAKRQRLRPREMPKELGGRDGPDPARYGDWEKKGIAIDF